ncbi:MAG: GntR family transcriptional regulator [Parvibaculaceae bacterium]
MSRVKAPSTFESVARQKLLEDILSGELAPGSRLKIRNLSERYSIGATPLREALSRLVPDGLVRVEQNKGFQVASLSLRELVELTEMRQILEAEAFRRSVERGDDGWESEVVASFHLLNKAIATYVDRSDSARRLEFEARHRHFHVALVAACGNTRLLHAVDALHRHLVRYRTIFQVTEIGAEELRFMHQELMRIAIEKDAESAASVMRRHVRVNVDQVKDGLRAKPELKALIEID